MTVAFSTDMRLAARRAGAVIAAGAHSSKATRGEILASPVRIFLPAASRRLGLLTSTAILLALTPELKYGIGDEEQYDC